MAKAVLIQNPTSIYKDQPGIRYHFPKMYLNTMRGCIGDWVVFYEGRKGALGYTSVQRVIAVRPDPDMDGHFFADLELGSQWQFEHLVPRTDPAGRPYESMLRDADGHPIRGGANTLAVRRLPDADFAAIVDRGLGVAADEVGGATGENSDTRSFQEPPRPFDHGAPLATDRAEILTSRKQRDASFARMVKSAYRGRCAMSGLMLRNGGGAAEVQAAHIRPVSHQGPDCVPNGLALSGTLHWMFDRGLLSVSDDYKILVADNKVDKVTVDRLIVLDRKLRLPEDRRDFPHPAYLRFHRVEIFGGSIA